MAQPQIEFMVGPEAASRAKPTAQLDTLEVTQAIQDLNAHKKSGPWTKVASFGTAELDASRSGSTLAQLRSRRENLAYSLGFRLPEKFTKQGTLWLLLGKVRDAASGVTRCSPGHGAVPVTVTVTVIIAAIGRDAPT